MSTKVEKDYYDNGQLKYEWLYQNGKRHGICKGWYKNGQPYYEYLYQDGKVHGVRKIWYKSGELECKYYYLYGEEVSPEEYRKHELITQLSGLENEHENQKSVL